MIYPPRLFITYSHSMIREVHVERIKLPKVNKRQKKTEKIVILYDVMAIFIFLCLVLSLELKAPKKILHHTRLCCKLHPQFSA